MRIAQVTPLYEAVPPKLYGGTERVVAHLTDALVDLGHDVTLFAAADAEMRARLTPARGQAIRLDPAPLKSDLAAHMTLLSEVMKRADEFDMIHFHTDMIHFPFFSSCADKTLTTLHGRLDMKDIGGVYERWPEFGLVSISDDQRRPLPSVNWKATVHHGMPGETYKFSPKANGYLAFLGRISPEKRPDRAIETAVKLNRPLKMAAKVDAADKVYWETVIRRMVEGNPLVEFIGEIGNHQKFAFLGGAEALLFPIDWPEPFGLVMIEAMARGTPVVAFRCGSTPEIIEDGETGFLVDTLEQAVAAAGRAHLLDRAAIRARFDLRWIGRTVCLVNAESFAMVEHTDLRSDSRPVIDLSRFDAAAFDLDGVITRTATVHATAWKQLFDEFLERRASGAGVGFMPFDSRRDYVLYVDGKPRLAGVRDFLASRTIDVPEGDPEDPPGQATMHGLARRKDELFLQAIARDGVEAFDGSIRLVKALKAAGLKLVVVSASENTAAILQAADLAALFDARVDGLVAKQLGLKGKPAPDTYLHAASLLDVAPRRMMGFEDALPGVEALRAAGYGLVVGVDRGGNGDGLASRGADLVATELDQIELRPRRTGDRRPSILETLPATRTTDPEWIIEESPFTPAREHEMESLFSVGNGFVGTRGSLSEGEGLSSPATFVAGVFEAAIDTTPGLVTAPDWTHMALTVEGRPVRLDVGWRLEHRRILDLRQAILWREWRQEDPEGRVTHVVGLRLASAADRHLLIQSVRFRPENYSGAVTLDTAVRGPLIQRTSAGTTIAMASTTRLGRGDEVATTAGDADLPAMTVETGEVYAIDRLVALHTSRRPGDPEALAREHMERAVRRNIADHVEDHRRAWLERWARSDIRIEGDPAAQKAARFAIYHLISAANPEDERTSIGARALTGSAYRGHVFWDTEIFMLPFFILTWPAAARSLLMYRSHTLPAARARAAALGWRGAFYAWESTDTGEDATPPLVTQPGGEVQPVLTGDQEQHISADVAYAVWSYWNATRDEAFLLEAGAEIILETARFWANRVERGDDGLHHIRGVIGPDEYHETVDDNAYTNAMARWNLTTGRDVAALMARRWPDRWRALSADLGLTGDEPATWATIADSLYTGFDEATGLIEQFRGYFDLEDLDLAALEPRSAPVDVVLGRERVQRSQLIKQADVVMLLHLFPDAWPPEVQAANFRYYEPRCGHGSSLSPAIHALVAARLGDMELASRYFRQAATIDLADNMGNAAGGLWQAIVFGFGGLHLTEDGPRTRPHLPPGWSALSMEITWRGQRHAIRIPPAGAPESPP